MGYGEDIGQNTHLQSGWHENVCGLCFVKLGNRGGLRGHKHQPAFLMTDAEDFVRIQHDEGNWIPGEDEVVRSLDESARYAFDLHPEAPF